MAVVSLSEMMEAGAHFGHQTRRWNPKMSKYIYCSRNGVHIIDLVKTALCMNNAYKWTRIFMAWFIPNLNDQKNIIGLEILASILSVGRNSRLVKILKEDSNLVESVYVDVNAGELGGLFIMEASCDSKDIDLVEKQINKTIDEISNCNALALDEIKKAINIVKSNYIFNLETSTQLSSFFGNELLWGRKSSINNLESHLKYWNDLDNFKEITEYISGEKFTLVASPGKC